MFVQLNNLDYKLLNYYQIERALQFYILFNVCSNIEAKWVIISVRYEYKGLRLLLYLIILSNLEVDHCFFFRISTFISVVSGLSING